MNYKEANTLLLNGQKLDKEGVKKFCTEVINNPDKPAWLKSVANFLCSWNDDSANIVLRTSGSTGSPKRIVVKKQHMVNSAAKTGEFLGLQSGDKALACLSADFIAGKMMFVRSMVLGLDLTMVEPAGNPLKDIDDDFAFAAMVPLQVYQILQSDNGEQKLNRIKKLIIGGGPVADGLRERIKKLTNSTYSTYGMTETVTHIAMEILNGPAADGFLHTLPGVEISTGENDKLVVYAPDIADEPVRTNDIALKVSKSVFKIAGRFDNMIITGGMKVFPELVEKKIDKLIDKRFMITSVDDVKLGKKVIIVIEDEKWLQADVVRLVQQLSKVLDTHEKPKTIWFLPKFPKTDNGKIKRNEVKKIIENSR
jgi:O-succinylbenzoic acid--CoA ligase